MVLRWQSVRTRIVVGVLCAAVLSLWAVTLTVSRQLRNDMQASISAQQFSIVSLIAGEVDRSVSERMAVLRDLASLVGRDGRAGDVLAKQAAIAPLFNWGIVITDARGVAIASQPEHLGRVGTNYGDVPFFEEVRVSGKAVITEPLIGKHTKVPLFTIAQPIFDPHGQFMGVVMGITNLLEANFLDEISRAKYGQTGDFLVSAPKSRVFIASSDKRRVMQAGPPVGVNALYDRYLEGFDGSGVATSSRGVEELSSSRTIASTGWLMQAVFPTEEAFAPIRAMQREQFLVATLLTLFAAFLAYWWVRQQLKPLEDASQQLSLMRDGIIQRQALPVARQDEIGELATAFNGLLDAIADQEVLLAENVANKRLRKVLAHVPGMVFQYRLFQDGTGAFPFASEAARAIYGVSPEELESSGNSIRRLVVSEDRDRFFQSMKVSRDTLSPWQVDYRIQVAEGSIKWLHVDAVPERDETGFVTWYGFVTDITATMAMEQELEQYRCHLEKLVEERTGQLAVATQIAQSASQAKSAFLANMSHEIRTPLNAITGMAHLIRRAGVTPQQADRLEKIEAAGHHLLEIINAVLELSKIEAGKFVLQDAEINIPTIFSNVELILADRIREKQLHFEVDSTPTPFLLRGDSTRLQQALLNYAANGVKFTDHGSVTLRQQVLEENAESVLIRFEVQDTGIGIEPAKICKLFSAFEQADNSTTRNYGGTGLGLAITKKIAEAMGGEAGVDSKLGEGSTFWFTARLQKETRPAKQSFSSRPLSAEARLATLPGHRILIVEDEPINREITLELLRSIGQITDVAENGQDAVALCEANGYDFILMDMQMPIMDGLEATRRIRQSSNGNAIPIVAMTANAFEEDRIRCFEAGMNDFLAKPVVPEKLYDTLLKWVQ